MKGADTMGTRSQGYVLGVIAGILISLVFLVILLKFTKKGKGIKCEYDERQERARGKGFQYGFFTLLIYQAVYGLFGDWLFQFADHTFLAVLGICLGAGVSVSYWIWHDSYISLNESFGRVVAVVALVAACNFALGISHIARGDFIEGGKLSSHNVNFMMGVFMLFVIGVLMLRKAVKGTEEDLE